MKSTIPIFILLVAFTTSLCQAQTPVLWGTTVMGGDYSNGNIFQYTVGVQVKSVYSLGNGLDGSMPWGSLVYANNKMLYGMTKAGGAHHLGALFSYDIYTGQEVVLHSFTNNNDGAGPNGSLIQASNNLLYGMTTGGGAGNGTIFSYDIVKDTALLLYNFAGGTNDGSIPYGSLTQVNDSMLYGLTLFGGANDSGTIFSYNINSGQETLLHSFAGNIYDGGDPWGSLLYANNGLLYGMTTYGGADSMGVIFTYDISTATEAVVHSFKVDTFGRYPYGSLIQAKNGLLYGMTESSGAVGNGMIFSFNAVTKKEKLIYNFSTLNTGERPQGSVMQASDGNLYGFTSAGGVNNDGILFSYDIQDSTLTKILDFNGPLGWQPEFGNLVEGDTANITTGINQFTLNNNQLTIYPNPSSGQFILRVSDKEKGSLIQVYNVVGENVYQSVANNLSNSINLGTQPEGIYFVYLKSEQGFTVKKVMISK